MKTTILTDGGLIVTERIVAVALAEAAPVRRMLQTLPADRLISMTGGHKRQTAVVLDSGHIILAALTLEEWRKLLGACPNDLDGKITNLPNTRGGKR